MSLSIDPSNDAPARRKPSVHPTSSGTLAPVGEGERYALIDVVRGFALFGVFLANMVWITQDIPMTEEQLRSLPTPLLDRIARGLVLLFVDGKFVTLFSFLFGLGFSIQLDRAERRGADLGKTYFRRLFVLLGFGVVHAYFLWHGDILQAYALMGFALYACRHWERRRLVAVGATLAIAPPALAFMIAGAMGIALDDPSGDAVKLARLDAFTNGPYSAFWLENFWMNLEFWTMGYFIAFLPAWFGRFLLGLAAGREGLLQDPARHEQLLRRLRSWGWTLGLLGNGSAVALVALIKAKVVSESSWLAILAQPIISLGIVALSAGYLGTIALAWQTPVGRARLQWLAPVGRMALTNYLTQTVMHLLLFYGVGLALMGRIGAALCLPIAMGLFAAQAVVSKWWLTHFQFGPMEWLWRALTYGEAPNWRATPIDMNPAAPTH